MGCEVLLRVHMKKESELERAISKLEDELEVKAVREQDLYAWDGIFGPLIYLSPEQLEVDGVQVTRVTFRLPRSKYSKYVPEGGLVDDDFE